MDIRDIRLNVIQVAVVIGQTIAVVGYVSRQTSKIDSVNESTTRIERNQEAQAADNKIWKAKIEADIADLKVRTALLEAKINTLGR
ncbi:hypothetical protein [Chitinophaga varians]|uniref:hypothetical protein n=1 Tax=Chitinophaga varians TaxID=2202339 RepID=UPI00165FF77E|nr:hypothetical protein [Chitinophaga varians]MBC9913195.1 hypothetical protein [Chitinophaga varians]